MKSGKRKKDIVYSYEGEKITVYFRKDLCTHVSVCLRELPSVFATIRRPWVMPDSALPDRLAEVIMRCPTGSLHFHRKDGGPQEPVPGENTIRVELFGPLYFRGNIRVLDEKGDLLREDTRVALCRCGATKNKPYCDGRHFQIEFRDPGEIDRPEPVAESTVPVPEPLTVRVLPDGPLAVSGPFSLQSHLGETKVRDNRTVLCSCGKSKDTPFCDGSHARKNLLKNLFHRQ